MTARLARATARAVLLLALAAVGFACKKSAPHAETIDAARVVSLSPSTTETLYAIGAGERLVGRSRYCDYPKEVLALPQVGGYTDPNLEAILALRPALVVGARGPSGPALSEQLATHGIATYMPETETFAEIDVMVRGIGDRTGHAREAAALVDRMHAREEAVARAVAASPRPRVLLVFGLAPIVVAGPGSFGAEMVARAGGDDAVQAGGRYPVLGVEEVLALDPDVVVNAAIAEAHGAERINRDAPGWGKLRAVREGRVVPLSDESVLRPGPRVGEAVAVMARAIHPEATIP